MLPEKHRFALQQLYLSLAPDTDPAIWKQIEDLHEYRRFSKGDVLHPIGEVCHCIGLVLSGVFRFYWLKSGKEYVGEFYQTGNLVSSFSSYLSGKPSRICIDCLVDGEVVLISRENEKILERIYPQFWKLTKLSRDKVYMQAYQRYLTHLVDSAEERYLNFLKTRPQLVLEIPQYMIASYLGITPEAFSRIRKNLSLKR